MQSTPPESARHDIDTLDDYPGLALGAICLVDSEALALAAFAAMAHADVLGFDTESKPTFQKGEAATGPHLIQLATDTRAFLFQVERLRDMSGLKSILESPHLLKVGFGLSSDARDLWAKFGIRTANVLDLSVAVRRPGERGTVGVKTAVAHFLGRKLQKSKKISTSNWASPRLNERQLLYAANDAHAALQVYRAWLHVR